MRGAEVHWSEAKVPEEGEVEMTGRRGHRAGLRQDQHPKAPFCRTGSCSLAGPVP